MMCLERDHPKLATKNATLRQRLVARIGHLYPLFSGCGTVANSKFVRSLGGSCSGDVWAYLRNGTRAIVPIDDFNGRSLFYVGDVDRKITWICTRIVRAGDHVVDIGANVGLITLTLAKLVGETGSVWSFEPNPSLAHRLAKSLDYNSMQQVHLQRCALGAESSELILTIPEGHSGRASLVRSPGGRSIKQVTVPVRTLSQVIPRQIAKIRLIKIDVEGYEPEVLRGAAELFERTQPDAVLFEINDVKRAVREEPSVQILRDYGYVFMAIPKTYLRMKVRWFDPDHDALPGHDLLACREGDAALSIASSVRCHPRRNPTRELHPQ